jgi:hypothetical protein
VQKKTYIVLNWGYIVTGNCSGCLLHMATGANISQQWLQRQLWWMCLWSFYPRVTVYMGAWFKCLNGHHTIFLKSHLFSLERVSNCIILHWFLTMLDISTYSLVEVSGFQSLRNCVSTVWILTWLK